MIDEIARFTLRGGVLVGAGALLGALFPNQTRQVARRAMVIGLQATDWARSAGAEAMEKGLDVMAEARMEHEQMVRAAEREAERRRLRIVRDGNVGGVAPAARRGAGTRGAGRGRARARRNGPGSAAAERDPAAE